MESEPRPEMIDLPVLQKFKLYSTPSTYYLIGRDESKIFRRILKIDRTEPDELNLFEDPTWYTSEEIRELKTRLDRGNKNEGGLKAVTTCYGIIGFVRFLKPYYMLVITKRVKVGEICGHTIYGIAESRLIEIPNPPIQRSDSYFETELKYKKLLCLVDLSKNFYFSYTYHLMYCLQKNICNTERGNVHDNTMFVWNAHLTREIRTTLQNTIWTVALVYGFFQQTKCVVSDENFVVTVIARRSRHYAGTRYLRRGVNNIGRVANDVETEQIVSKEVPKGQKIPITSVVQVRGSIPLFWSQETSPFNPKPKIKLYRRDTIYEATRYHFDNLRLRYGKHIFILNLLKSSKKERREANLGGEFEQAILFINRGMVEENWLNAIHFDLSSYHKSGVDVAFTHLCNIAKEALESTNLFFCKAPSGVGAKGVFNELFFNNPLPSDDEDAITPDNYALKAVIYTRQNGVLRTNCIDCLDRTNYAQYANGLVALRHQLRTLGIVGPPILILDNPLALSLMETYQNMGDILALQYGGSEAHSKLFDDLKGDRNMGDILISWVRYYNNSYLDSRKQNAINLFLGHFRPQLGSPDIWELHPDENKIVRISSGLEIRNPRPLLRRSFSDTNLLDGDVNLGHENPQPRENHLIRTGSSQMLQGSSSNSDSRMPNDRPGFSHSYRTTFIPAEVTFDRCSSMSSDNYDVTDVDEIAISRTSSNIDYEVRLSLYQPGDIIEVPGFSNEFCQWVFFGTTLM